MSSMTADGSSACRTLLEEIEEALDQSMLVLLLVGASSLLLLLFLHYQQTSWLSPVRMTSLHNIRLSELLNLVRQQLAMLPEQTLKETVSSVLAANEGWKNLLLDIPLVRDGFEDRVIDALASAQQIGGLYSLEAFQGKDMQYLLQRAHPHASCLCHIAVIGTPLSTLEADSIFTLLQCSTRLQVLTIYLAQNYSEGVLDALQGFLRNSASLRSLEVGWHSSTIPEQRFKCVCEAVESSVSIKTLDILGNRLSGSKSAEETASFLARTLANSTSLREFQLTRTQDTSFLPADTIEKALLKTPAVRNLDLLFRTKSGEQGKTRISLTRVWPWKRVLPLNIPLNLWPRILSNADQWNKQTSHTSFDALFYLLKEKNDVLLQNVRKRRIHKCKSYQISSS